MKKSDIKKAQEENPYGAVVIDNPDGTVDIEIDQIKFMEACLANEEAAYNALRQIDFLEDDDDPTFWEDWDKSIAKMKEEIIKVRADEVSLQ